ncbi:zf-CSL-domain-containing protein [Lactarius deliciosus]|nr:zf-CSL-domain-containing protein [Lactarius deliciosus]
MGAYYDEIEIEDMAWDDEKGVFHYPVSQLANCEDIATCPSCSLIIRVIYDPLDFEDEPSDDEGASASEQEEDDGVDSDGGEDVFEDAMENLAISEKPRLVAVTA